MFKLERNLKNNKEKRIVRLRNAISVIVCILYSNNVKTFPCTKYISNEILLINNGILGIVTNANLLKINISSPMNT